MYRPIAFSECHDTPVVPADIVAGFFVGLIDSDPPLTVSSTIKCTDAAYSSHVGFSQSHGTILIEQDGAYAVDFGVNATLANESQIKLYNFTNSIDIPYSQLITNGNVGGNEGPGMFCGNGIYQLLSGDEIGIVVDAGTVTMHPEHGSGSHGYNVFLRLVRLH